VTPSPRFSIGRRSRLLGTLLTVLLAALSALAATAGGSEPSVTIFTAGITPGSGPNAITRGPDGAMWFTEYHGDKIGRVAADGTVTEFPSSADTGSNPSGITLGPDGDIWFATYGSGTIGQLDPATGEILTETKIPNGSASKPDGIISGPGGDLWFAEQGEGEIGRIDPGTHQVEQFPIGGSISETLKPSSLAVGPEGDIWFTLTGTGQVGRLDPEKLEEGKGFTLYDLPSGAASAPEGITFGPEGDAYVAELDADRIARVEPGAVEEETEKGITEFHADASPLLATTTSEGTIWFTSAAGKVLIRLDPAHPEEPRFVGVSNGITGDPTGLAEDSEGHLWFTQFQTAAVGRLSLSTAKSPTIPIVVNQPHLEPIPEAKFKVINPVSGGPILNAAESNGNGSPIAGYKIKIVTPVETTSIECGAGAPVAQPEFSKAISGTATVTVTDVDGQSSSTSSPIVVSNPVPIVLKHPPGKARGSGLVGGPQLPIVPVYKCSPAGGESEAAQIAKAGTVSSSCEVVAGILRIEGCGMQKVEGLCAVPAPTRALIERHLIPGLLENKVSGCNGVKALFASRRGAHAASTVGQSVKAAETLLNTLQDTFYVSTHPVRINGITVEPIDGASIAVPVGGLINSSFAKQYAVYLESTSAELRLGGFPLSKGRLDLDVSNIGGAEATFANFNLKAPVGFGQFAKLALGYFIGGVPDLPIEGGLKASFVKDGKTRLDLNLELNKIISDGLLDENNLFTGATSVEASNDKGLELDSFDIEVPELPVPGAPFSFKPINLHYDREKELFAGTLGVDFGEGSINASVAFEHGLFKEGGAQYLADKGYGFDVAGPVFLIELGANFTLYQAQNPGSTTSLNGNATLSLGPALSDNGCGIVDVFGSASINLGPGPFSISTDAEQRILCVPLKKSYFTVNSEGYVELGSSEELNIPDIGSLSTNEDGQAYASFAKGQFHLQLDGSGRATIDGVGSVGVETVISDRGIGACAEIGYPGGTWRPGIGESFVPLPLTAAQFISNLSIAFDGCELSQYQSIGPGGPPAGNAARAAASSYSFDVPASETTAVVKLTGAGGAPAVTLTGPGGRTIDTTANSSSAQQLILRQPSTNTTLVMIRGAKTGRWTVTPDAGSVALAAVATARELPRPKISAHLSGHGARRTLHYSIAAQPGMQVSFEEAGKNGGQLLGSAHGARGSISFIPSGASGRRSIIALVTENGEPRTDLTVASFSSPPPRPGRTGSIRLSRSKGGLLVSFRPAPLSTATVLSATFAEGRSVLLLAPHGRNSLLIAGVAKSAGLKAVRITALRGAVAGPAVRVHLPKQLR
jgi:virginiamycin B lyase